MITVARTKRRKLTMMSALLWRWTLLVAASSTVGAGAAGASRWLLHQRTKAQLGLLSLIRVSRVGSLRSVGGFDLGYSVQVQA
jgi:hypothetical protein